MCSKTCSDLSAVLHPTVYNTSQVCFQLGIKHAVFSPGSRNAPLTISFARNQSIKKYIIPDERSAGFIGLGIAQSSKSPVVLSCTSGTALLNYAPAIAEAYYREIPLLILSADRPPELIDQRDGQTIRQFESLRNHVKASYQLPLVDSETASDLYTRELVSAIKTALEPPYGPVHINIPFSEPFYPTSDQELVFTTLAIEGVYQKEPQLPPIIVEDYSKILVVIGQEDPNPELEKALSEINGKIPVITSPLSNISQGIKQVDAFILDQGELQPELLITTGKSVLSKRLKNFLRKHKPKRHLHFDPAGVSVDTYQSNPEVITSELADFLKDFRPESIDVKFYDQWKTSASKANQALESFMDRSDLFSESKVSWNILHRLNPKTILHLSNSMPVRYADLFDCFNEVTLSNRGTSGIDGCTSTALGSALVTLETTNVLLTGDLAFLYDRNAFFHNYPVPNLRIVVLNNAGGGIFRLIKGPSDLPELEEYFETRHNRTAEYICAENQLGYFPVSNFDELDRQWEDFMESGNGANVLEVFTEPSINQEVYKKLRTYIDEQVNN